MNTLKKIAFIVNGRNSASKKLTSLLKSAFGKDYYVEIFITEYPAHSIKLASEAINKEFSHIICVGGDGSLNEVVNGVMLAVNNLDGNAKNEVRFGLLPKGTGNDFARTLHITDDITELKKSIDEDNYAEIDLGIAKFTGVKGINESRFFINITDIGMGGVIVQKLESYSKWMGAFLTFQRAIITTLLNYKKQHVNAQADNFNYNGEVMVLAIANGKYFGGGLGIAPEAVATDGKFSIIIVGKVTTIEYLRLFGSLKNCKKIIHPEIKYYSASQISLNCNATLPIDMDGEFIGYTPLTITIVPKAIKILASAK